MFRESRLPLVIGIVAVGLLAIGSGWLLTRDADGDNIPFRAIGSFDWDGSEYPARVVVIREPDDMQQIGALTGTGNPTWESFTFLMRERVDLTDETVIAFFPVRCFQCEPSTGNLGVEPRRVDVHGDVVRLVVGWRDIYTGGDVVAFRWVFIAVPKSELPEDATWEVRDDKTGTLLRKQED